MKPFTVVLRDDRDRQVVAAAVQRYPLGVQVRITKPDRNAEQNRHYHALLGDIAKQLVWPPPPKNDGALHDIEWWKRRTTLGWLIETKQEREVVESLEGDEFALLLPHTSHLDAEKFAGLIEWTASFGAHNGVVFKEPKQPEPPPEAYE